MNRIESIVYNMVRKNPALKQMVRNMYQGIFDLLPKKKEFFAGEYSFAENCFFGFHDVTPFSEDDTKILANKLHFDLRMPKAGEKLSVGYYDLNNGMLGEFHEIDKSSAWNYHKGCRLQWLDNERVIFNTSKDNKLVSKIVNVFTKDTKYIDYPFDAVYVNREEELATSFSYERLNRCMPGYGYPYADDGMITQAHPENNGLFIVDLRTNKRELVVSLNQLAPYAGAKYDTDYLHFVTHTEFSKDGRYISFLYRCIPMEDDYMKRHSMMVVYDRHNKELFVLDTQESGSHYVWNNRNQIVVSVTLNNRPCHAVYDIDTHSGAKIVAGDILNSDGHQTFIDDDRFMTDTYPDKYRMARVYEADMRDSSVRPVLSVYSPKNYQTKDFTCHIACDLHPRMSKSGKYMSFDSPRTGKRCLYVMKLK